MQMVPPSQMIMAAVLFECDEMVSVKTLKE